MEDEEYRLMMDEKAEEDTDADIADIDEYEVDEAPEADDAEIAADEEVFDQNVGNEGWEGIA